MKKILLTSLLLVALFQCPSTGDNWAHWRGPTGNGVAPGARPPIRWSNTENVKWKVAIPGRSSGSPVIWEDRVFLVTAVPAGNDAEPQTRPPESSERPPSQGAPGRGRFQRRRRPGGGEGGGQLPRLAFKVLCLDRNTGQLLWEKTANVATPHQATHATNGFASASPCTDGKHVYAHFGSRGLYCYTMDGELEMETR